MIRIPPVMVCLLIQVLFAYKVQIPFGEAALCNLSAICTLMWLTELLTDESREETVRDI